MSSTSATSSSTADTGTLGDAPPVSFPGISSGIDYNSIIEKYTAATLAQEAPTKAQINNLNTANAAILKIQNLFGAVQSSLTALSDPGTFNAYKPTVGNTINGSPVSTAKQISGLAPLPGVYQINSQKAATSTQVANNTATTNAPLAAATPLLTAGTAITASNGSNGTGLVTINGKQIAYDVTTQDITTIIANINAALAGTERTTQTAATAAGSTSLTVASPETFQVGQSIVLDAGTANQETVTIAAISGNTITTSATTFAHSAGATVDPAAQPSATWNAATQEVTLTGVTTLGSGADSGNLLSVLKLDNAQIQAGGTIVSSSTVSGVNQSALLNSANNAGFATAVTAGTFTINGVQFTVDPTKDALSDVISRINSSTAGVTAAYDPTTSSITLTNKVPGAQSILLSAGTDTSNFLSATGLSGGATTAGTQASITYTNGQGVVTTAYSQTNDFTNVIAGVDITVTATSTAGYTIGVAPDPSGAEKAINTFVKAYNAALDELTKDTQAPTTVSTISSTTGQQVSGQGSAGGPLYDNFQITNLRTQLIGLVSGFIPTGSQSYNSLASIGLKLDTASESVGAVSDDDTSSSGNTDGTISVNGTTGKLAALDTTAFEAAYAANAGAVSSLFTLTPLLTASGTFGTSASGTAIVGAPTGIAYSLGSLLANADGAPTFLKNSLVSPDNLASVLLNSITDSNSQQIKSLEQQITLINTEANQQANSLRASFSASETQIADLQSLQSVIAAIGH